MHLNPNDLIKDRYRIEEQLGRGGMGAVWLATDSAVDRKVALKANLNPGVQSRRQFEREARLLAGVRHPNLPLVTDHFVQDDVQYLVMDFVPGEDLTTRLKSEGAQPIDKVLSWGKQLGDALTYLHTQDPPIIHRDIKPSNVKITPDGQAILVDFGIAKSADQGMTSTGARGFSPGFAPPEQYGSTSTGPYSDQYALAATLYALLTGQSPADSVERMLGQAHLVPPRDLNPEIPKHVATAIERALSVEPVNRFASVAEFVSALKDRAFSPSTKPKPTVLARSQQPKRRSPWVLIGIAGVIGAVIVGALAFMGVFGGGLKISIVPTQKDTLPVVVSVNDTPTPVLFIPTNTLAPELIPTDTVGASLTPTPTGSGGLIAFVSNRAHPFIFQVFTMKPDGSDVTQITFDEVSKSQPRWSPDGKKLLYVAKSTGPNELDIWVINADGTDPVNLTNLPGQDYDPSWSPDGTKIAFTTTRVGDVEQIFIMNADGSNPQFITRGYAVETEPVWSPDGQLIAFVSSINNGTPNIWLRTGGGGDPRPFDLSFRLGWSINPSWSPDGTYIAFTQITEKAVEIVLAVVEDKGATLYQLTNTLGNRDPDWSPDGQWIVFTSTRDQNQEIYIMDVTGGIQNNLTNTAADINDREPDWQPMP